MNWESNPSNFRFKFHSQNAWNTIRAFNLKICKKGQHKDGRIDLHAITTSEAFLCVISRGKFISMLIAHMSQRLRVISMESTKLDYINLRSIFKNWKSLWELTCKISSFAGPPIWNFLKQKICKFALKSGSDFDCRISTGKLFAMKGL